jgi:hypothetical protein
MKKNNKINPLTYFNNLKADAVKKAGKDMSTYKKSLPKAQDGLPVKSGPLSEEDTKRLDLFYKNNMEKANKIGKGSTPSLGGYSAIPMNQRNDVENMIRTDESQSFNTQKVNVKKGGFVKSKKK